MQLTEFDYDVVVVGGGAVGLSAGYYCAEAGMNTVVVERHERFCEEASTHNSGVLHSGFNPEPGTLKSRLNIEGLSLMYRKSEEWKFRTKKVGTMVAATTKQEERRLLLLKADGERNGVTGLELLKGKGVRDVEPDVENVIAALYSPEGGVIDIMEYLARLQARAALAGAVLAPGRDVSGIRREGDGLMISFSNGESISTRFAVNSAGISSDIVASMTGCRYTIHPCVGEYAFVAGEKSGLVRGMIYPVREEGSPGLGTHLTATIDGQLQVGPTAVYADSREPLSWRKTPMESFLEAVRRFFPSVNLADMREGWYGVRAKIVPPGSGRGFSDFKIEWDRNMLPVVHLVGIESPGLTASLAIGRHVMQMIAERNVRGS